MLTSIIVGSHEVTAWQNAAWETPGTHVEVVRPTTEQQRREAVLEHVRTLAVAGEVAPEDAADAKVIAFGALLPAFEDPDDPAVLIRITTAVGDDGLADAESLIGAFARQFDGHEPGAW